MTAVLAVENSVEGHEQARYAIDVAAAGEMDLVLWPVALLPQGRYLRSDQGLLMGWNYWRGAKWASGYLGCRKGAIPRVVLVPDTRNSGINLAGAVTAALRSLNASVIYIVREENSKAKRLRESAEAAGLTVREFQVMRNGGTEP